MKTQVAIIVGTRPEAIKLIPVYLAMQKSETLEPVLISTGQHKEMLAQIFTFFGVQPNIELDVMLQGQTLTQLTARIVDRLGNHIAENNYKTVIVQGDTTTAFIAGLVAYYHQIPVGHVEAGLRTYDKYSPFPEEVNRRLIGTFAQFNFAPTSKAVEALKKENIDGIYMVGNTVVDSLLLCYEKVQKQEASYEQEFGYLWEGKEKLTLITGHRRESFGEGFLNMCRAIRRIAERYEDMTFVYPVHLNPNVKKVVHEELSGITNVQLIQPLPYDKLIYLMSKANMILTDSGGIQEEAPTFDVPIVVMRNKTEREEGIEAGCAVLAGTTEEGIVSHFTKIMDDADLYAQMTKAKNPYGDGTTSQQIVEILEKYFQSL
ncbi:MAG: UDP-N-acetylglucosamine 2-epimerase (non-hydrolyzing) [Aureispira sp.]|nr:UDP-N-acetylglucosamine 2-epimerase (non-hydrolyzing) [Aureispira sp.]